MSWEAREDEKEEAQRCKAESVGRREGGGWGRQEGLNQGLQKEGQGYSPQCGDQIFSGSAKNQPRINYSPRDVGETGGRTS